MWGGTVENTMKGGGAEQRGGDTKISKRGGQAVSGGRGRAGRARSAGGGGWNPLTNMCCSSAILMLSLLALC